MLLVTINSHIQLFFFSFCYHFNTEAVRRPCAALAYLCKSESPEFHLLSPRQGDRTAVKVDCLTADVSLVNKNCEQEEEVVVPCALTASPPPVSLTHNGAGIIWMDPMLHSTGVLDTAFLEGMSNLRLLSKAGVAQSARFSSY